jgi:hypothetical protein
MAISAINYSEEDIVVLKTYRVHACGTECTYLHDGLSQTISNFVVACVLLSHTRNSPAVTFHNSSFLNNPRDENPIREKLKLIPST